MKFGLKFETIDRINRVFSEFLEIDEVIIYGSRAMGNYQNGSDIDLTIKGPALNQKIINSISLKLDSLFLPYSFDLSIYEHLANQDLRDHIKRVGIIFYKKTKP